MNKHIWMATLAALWALHGQAAVVVIEEVSYRAYRLDVADDAAAGPFSRATASNVNGQVVGYYRLRSGTGGDAGNVSSRGFTAYPSPVPVGDYAKATRVTPDTGLGRVFVWDVNDGGVMVGGARLSTQRDFLYAFYQSPLTSIGGFSSLGYYSETRGVNAGGAAVGYVCPSARDCIRIEGAGSPSAFYFHPDTHKEPLLGFPNLSASASQANAINDKGIIAGSFVTDADNRALRYDWNAQQGEDLHEYFADAVSSEALAVNISGDVAGRAGFARSGGGTGSGNVTQQAFVIEQGTKEAALLEAPSGYEGSAALDIADNGWVVGTACASGKDCGTFVDDGALAKPEDNTAVLWAYGLPFDLSLLPGLMDDTTDIGWAKLSFAEAITDMGKEVLISGVGYYSFGTGIALERRAFVLRIDESSVPIPEPRTYLLLGAGLLMLGAARLRVRAQ